MRIRTTAAAVLVAAAGTIALSGVAQAQTDERDCGDFGSQRQAQRVLDSPAGDPQRLDADGDGTACEIWFADRGGDGASGTGSGRSGSSGSDSAGSGSAGSGSAGSGSTGSGSTGSGSSGSGSSGSDTGPVDAGSDPESAGIGDPTGSTVPAGAVRQVTPVPRGGVGTGVARRVGPPPPSPAPPGLLVLAAFAVAATAAAGAASAASGPVRTVLPRSVGARPAGVRRPEVAA